MEIGKFFVDAVMAVIGGCLGASVSALGGFVLLGLAGTGGFIYMLVTGDTAWISVVGAGILLKPSSCFLGGVVATAYTRKKNLIQCGKDIGRSLVSFRRMDILLAGSLGGLAGYVLNTGLNIFLAGRVDTTALTIVIISLALKYVWGMTKTNDCEASSHAVPSPFRFFDKLSNPVGQIILSVLMGTAAVLVTWLLTLNAATAPFAGGLMFFFSALSLYVVFLGVPLPPTHHYTGPAGVITVYWLALHGNPSNFLSAAVLALWGIAAAAMGMAFCSLMGKLFFDEGDIHVDPPTMGIMLTTAVCLSLLPLTGVFRTGLLIQGGVGLALIIVSILFLVFFKMRKRKRTEA